MTQWAEMGITFFNWDQIQNLHFLRDPGRSMPLLQEALAANVSQKLNKGIFTISCRGSGASTKMKGNADATSLTTSFAFRYAKRKSCSEGSGQEIQHARAPPTDISQFESVYSPHAPSLPMGLQTRGIYIYISRGDYSYHKIRFETDIMPHTAAPHSTILRTSTLQ